MKKKTYIRWVDESDYDTVAELLLNNQGPEEGVGIFKTKDAVLDWYHLMKKINPIKLKITIEVVK